MNNLTAGTGTPYWYEWSVGLLYVAKMLNPDNQIKNVVLQSDESQSLDDVVITYENGMKDFIQVKHTREDDKVSYSDMIEGDLKKSYLYKYSSEWKEMEKKNTGKNRVIFFTNRKMGNQKYTPKGEWQRPSLSKFWKDIKSQVNNLLDTDDSDNADISKIDVKKEWTDAWKAWKDHMGALNEREQLLFMKNFDLITDQEDLDGIIDTIADGLCEVFATTHEKAVTLHQKLCYQLMWWSTSICDKKEIEKEDVMQALSLGGDEVKGEHILCAKRLGYNTLEEKMKERAPLEYAQERLDSSMHSCIIPSRWYESEYYANMEDFFDNVEQLSIDEMFSYIEEEFHRGDFSWDYIRYFIQKAKCKDSKYVSKYKPQIMEMLDKREINSLEYDGCNRLYEVLFPYLTDDEVNNVLNNVVSTYYYHKEKGWASTDYGLMTDLEHFTFALFSRFDLNDNIWALNEILKMHCLWISGTETLGIGEVYQFRENDKTITGWLDMFEKLV